MNTNIPIKTAESNISDFAEQKKPKRIKIIAVRIVGVILTLAALIGLMFCIQGSLNPDYGITFILNGETVKLQNVPYEYEDSVMIPVREVYAAMGAEVSWQDEPPAIVINYNGRIIRLPYGYNVAEVNRKECMIDPSPQEIFDIMYFPAKFIADTINAEINFDEETQQLILNTLPMRDVLQHTHIPNDYRSASEVISTDGFIIADGRSMELIRATEEDAVKYADIVSDAAAFLPNVDVYEVLVPTSAEFYAPEQYYPNQLKAIRKAYESTELNVNLVNAVDPLVNHADEYIYFKTDHHWTQRGAYYAYKAFIEAAGDEIAPIDEFETYNSEGVVGSFYNFTSDPVTKEIVKQNADTLERFLPSVSYTGAAYADALMQKVIKEDVKAVSLDENSYSAFLDGDNPLTVFKTDAKTDKSVAIIKESFGNAFSAWALNNYNTVYIIDSREFNGFNDSTEPFDIKAFYELTHFDDLVFISYPVSVGIERNREAIHSIVGSL